MKKRTLVQSLQAETTYPPDAIVGVCWYGPKDWERVKAAAADPDLFEDSFAEWETMANDGFEEVRAAHAYTVKVPVSADDFFLWCHIRGKINNAEARAEFVSDLLRKPSASYGT